MTEPAPLGWRRLDPPPDGFRDVAIGWCPRCFNGDRWAIVAAEASDGAIRLYLSCRACADAAWYDLADLFASSGAAGAASR